MNKLWPRSSLASICIRLALTACNGGSLSQAPSVPPQGILLEGKRYTFINDGRTKRGEGLAPCITASRVAGGGYTLGNDWGNADTLNTLHAGIWNYVVLRIRQ
jgi:hypothetical protein